MNKSISDFDKYKSQAEMWKDSHIILGDVELHRQAASKILPLGLRLTEKPTATLFIVDYLKPNFTAPYREAALLIHVKTLFGRGLHCAWMTVDDDTAMIYGRELLGYPKKMADIPFEETETTSTGSVTRRGVEDIIKMRAVKGDRQSEPAPIFDQKMFNPGGLGNFMALQGIWMSRSKEFINESYAATVQLSLTNSITDPIQKLIASPEISNGRIAVFDIIGGRYLLPVGFAGPFWVKRTSYLRMR